MPRGFPSQVVVELALEIGFDLAGITPLRPPRGAPRFRDWLRAGHQADMGWLEEQQARILDPRLSLPEGHSLLAVGLGHSRPAVALSDGGRIARYAGGRDYHNTVGRMLRKLARTLRERGILGQWKKVVDAGPLLERSHAAEAGLGFESKAANLLHPRFGPWFFLGELLLDAEVEPTPTPPSGSCGTCTACLDACPTQAILSPGVVDARLCLSYQTIENRGSIPHELRDALGDWVFGCDVCSEVCPWGSAAPDVGSRLGTHPAVAGGSLADWLSIPEEHFEEYFRGSPLKRPGRDGLLRNAALVLGNRPGVEGQASLEGALGDRSATVREAAHWALSKSFSDRRTRGLLEKTLSREPDAAARARMERTQRERL